MFVTLLSVATGPSGAKRSHETLEKMGSWQRGKPKSKDSIEKMRKSHKGKPLSEKHKESIRLNRGATGPKIGSKMGQQSPEHIANKVAAWKAARASKLKQSIEEQTI